MGKFVLGLSVVAGIIAVLIFQTIWGGFVFSWLWEWYAVPFGLPPISVAWGIGIMLIIRTPQQRQSKGEQREFGEIIFESFLLSGMVFFIGWVCSFWM
jgi:hypothetical protein